MRHRDLVVIGASAGGLTAISRLIRDLPSDFPASILVVIHTAPDSHGFLGPILDRAGLLPASLGIHGERIEKGRIYVAPPDRHMVLEDGKVLLLKGPKQNGFRPAVDPLFISAAHSHGPRVIGVILSGGGFGDGSYGAIAIKKQDGIVIVQDPQEATVQGMPLSAIRSVAVDHVLPVARIASLLVKLTAEPMKKSKAPKPRADEKIEELADVGDVDGRWLHHG